MGGQWTVKSLVQSMNKSAFYVTDPATTQSFCVVLLSALSLYLLVGSDCHYWLIIDSFNTVLFSALKQTHGAPVVGDSEWVTVAF